MLKIVNSHRAIKVHIHQRGKKLAILKRDLSYKRENQIIHYTLSILFRVIKSNRNINMDKA